MRTHTYSCLNKVICVSDVYISRKGIDYLRSLFLSSWLKEWKLRADREERRKQKEKKQEEGSSGEILIFKNVMYTNVEYKTMMLSLNYQHNQHHISFLSPSSPFIYSSPPHTFSSFPLLSLFLLVYNFLCPVL